MIEAYDVYTALQAYHDISAFSITDLLPSCQRALNWVQCRLRDGVDPDNPLILETTAAVAHYFFCLYRITDPDKYESSKVGDVTCRRNLLKELEFEKQARNQAIADAACILKDGGFYCCGR